MGRTPLPEQIVFSQIAVALEAIAKAGARAADVAAIGITNQRETTIVWNREKPGNQYSMR